MKTTRLWGFEKISLSPIYFNYSRLKYALIALKNIHNKVLEAGGGAGAFSRAISENRPDLELICTDIDSKLISFAAGLDKKNTYKVADIEHLPFKKEEFDGVVSFDVVEHLDNPQAAFNEAYRILKKGGVLHFAIPLEGSLFTLHGIMTKIGITPKEKYAGHIHQFSKSDIIKMLKKGDFKGVSYKFSGHYLYQFCDFIYFLFLQIFTKKPDHTVEGFIEGMRNGLEKKLLILLRAALSFVFFVESFVLQDFPGQIGHFTAYK